MIRKATQDYPEQEWKLLDAGKDIIPGTYDLVFSNATIQWIPEHFSLFKRFWGIMTKKGTMAVQLPLFFDMPLGKSIARISKEFQWAHVTETVSELFTIHHADEYYDMLSEIFQSCEIWETDYIHVMDSHEAILEMIRSTGLRPYLDKLDAEEDKERFEAKVLSDIRNDYKAQQDGKVLFPFKRLFLIAKKSGE